MELLGYFGALCIGLILGLTGGGGSILTVPILVYVMLIDPMIATAYSLFIVGASSLVGALPKYKQGFVNLKTAIIFGIPSIDSKGNPITITRVGAVKLTPNEFTYQLTTPFKLSGGAAYFFGKRGLLSLDLEYVNYPGMQVSSVELSAADNINFENKYNGQTKKNFQF